MKSTTTSENGEHTSPGLVILIGSPSDGEESPVITQQHGRGLRRSTSRATASPLPESDLARKNGILTSKDLSPDDEITSIMTLQAIPGVGNYYVVKSKRRGIINVTPEVLDEYPELIQDYQQKRKPRNDESDSGEEGDEFEDGTQQSEESPESAQESEAEVDGAKSSRRNKSTSQRPAKVKQVSEPTRRSSRATRHQEAYTNEDAALKDLTSSVGDSESDEGQDPSSDVEIVSKPPRIPKSKVLIDVKTKVAADQELEESASLLFHHKAHCEKCGSGPADELLEAYIRKKKRKYGKRRIEQDDEQDIKAKGAWFQCDICCNAVHFNCLSKEMQLDIARSVKAHAKNTTANLEIGSGSDSAEAKAGHKSTPAHLDIHETLSLPACQACLRVKGTYCHYCRKEHAHTNQNSINGNNDSLMKSLEEDDREKQGYMFRCYTCQRATHYECMPDATDGSADVDDLENQAAYYQNDWTCADCDRWDRKVELVLAWKPVGTVETDKVPADLERPSHKDPGAAVEYLVKFIEDSYRHVEWVPHAWLLATHSAKLRNFLVKGSDLAGKFERDSEKSENGEEGNALGLDLRGFGKAANPHAEYDIPTDWFTAERILQVEFAKRPNGSKRDLAEDPDESIDEVVRVLVKWKSLPYSEATWDSFDSSDQDYPAYKIAYSKWLRERKIVIPKLGIAQLARVNRARPNEMFVAVKQQPDYIGGTKHLKLMDFQADGVNWLYYKWWQKKNGVLSDEMGLGKTVQVISFLSTIFKEENAQPFLIVVPNSTIANWVREFETWAPPEMKVTAYFGSSASRQLCGKYDLFTEGRETLLRAHVVIVTYESITADAALFRKVQRFDTLIVDEAQRLKAGDTGLLFKALQSLEIGSKFLLTGTPLNNSVSEILNLMHFLDPDQFEDLKAMKDSFEDLNAEKVQKLQDLLKPYFLRRRKEEVLDLPPLVETIVPVSLRPLQKKFYINVIGKNLGSMSNLFRAGQGKVAKMGSLNNILMQLRKICQSPYLFSEDIEPVGLSTADAHSFLVDASAKFTLLSKLLPRLLEKGHRILIFSQFLGVLDLLGRFLEHENVPFTGLSGSSSQSERQDSIDAFNAPESKLKVFVLSTRAGGVGINLTSADTVIMFDQDFNPMQDIQAISRAHRIGQTKPVICYKLLVKGTCEEKILSASKKKLALEHVIVSRMSAEETEAYDVEATLQYGARALFEQGEGESEADIKYTETDIDQLIAKTELEVKNQKAAEKTSNEANKVFAFAKIWERDDPSTETAGNVDENAAEDIAEQRQFWSKLLHEQQLKDKEEEARKASNMGRGRRQRKQIVDLTKTLAGLSPSKNNVESDDERAPKRRKSSEDGSDYEMRIDSDVSNDDMNADVSRAFRKEFGERTTEKKLIINKDLEEAKEFYRQKQLLKQRAKEEKMRRLAQQRELAQAYAQRMASQYPTEPDFFVGSPVRIKPNRPSFPIPPDADATVRLPSASNFQSTSFSMPKSNLPPLPNLSSTHAGEPIPSPGSAALQDTDVHLSNQKARSGETYLNVPKEEQTESSAEKRSRLFASLERKAVRYNDRDLLLRISAARFMPKKEQKDELVALTEYVMNTLVKRSAAPIVRHSKAESNSKGRQGSPRMFGVSKHQEYPRLGPREVIEID